MRRRWTVVFLAALAACLMVPAAAHAAEGKAMYRLYNRWTGEHFYTADAGERDSLEAVGWAYEGEAWSAPAASGTPVYRLYNGWVPGGDHHYTTDANEYAELEEAGWSQEGVGWYSDDARGEALYRLYNPYAATGTHHYTADAHERDELEGLGWKAEGIAWYGVKGSTGEDYDARPCNHIIVWGHYVDADGEKWPQCIICGQLFSKLAFSKSF